MTKKEIVVAGGGHGGFAVAGHLAKMGYAVTVYEKNGRDCMGYDWTDIFAPNALTDTGIPMLEDGKWEYKNNMTFVSPDQKTRVDQNIPEWDLEIKAERKDIYAHLIKYAEENGAKVEFGVSVDAPIIVGNRVVGIKTSVGDIYADLVIDACGMNSLVRSQLPPYFDIEPEVGRFNQFYVYRAFYKKTGTFTPKDKYQVFLLHNNKLGISWLATEGDVCDILIGRFEPFDAEEVERTLSSLRKTNPCLSDEIVRGGQFVNIPVRRPLSVLVAHGYAAIGDAAFMTVPIIGSGIANSLKAAKMLANAVEADKDKIYSAETLWQYQKEYYKQLGTGFCILDCVKAALTQLTPDEISYMFSSKMMRSEIISIGANSTDIASMINLDAKQLAEIARSACADKKLLKKLLGVGKSIAESAALCAQMPKAYSKSAVSKWSKKYVACRQKIYR